MTTINPKFIDLSHYDNLYDIGQVKAAGYLGIINKASEGPGMGDRTFAIRRPVVLGAGMKYGAYHFLRPGDMYAQAQHFRDVVGDPAGLALAADWEVPGVSVRDIEVFVTAVHEWSGRWPIVYSYQSMLIDKLGTRFGNETLAQCPLWLAAYNSNPRWPQQIWPRFWGWQFTGDGNGPGPKQVPGIVLPGSRGIDINSFDGTDEEFLAAWPDGTTPLATV